MTSNGWEIYKLKNLCTKIGSGATPRGGKETYLEEGPYALVRSQNVLDFFFSYDGLAFIDEDQANQLSNVEIQERDVLLNITGDSVARVCQVPKTLLPARVNQHVSIIRADNTKLLPEYLKYFLLNPKFKKFLHGLASVGATRNALTKGMIEDLDIALPPLPIQRRIADILSALDEKIELNRQTNATLEAITQSIFKEWFVENKEVENWKTGKVGDVVRRIPVGKKYDFKTALPEGKVPILDQSHFTIIGYHNEKPGIDANVDNPVLVFSNHRCYTDIIHFPFSAIQNVLPFIGDGVDTRWLYHATDGIITYSEYKGHFPEFISKPLVIPPKDLTEEFGELVKPLHIKIMRSKEESRTLASLRDALLPKLMSGEIEV